MNASALHTLFLSIVETGAKRLLPAGTLGIFLAAQLPAQGNSLAPATVRPHGPQNTVGDWGSQSPAPAQGLALLRLIEQGAGLQTPVDIVTRSGDERLYIVDMVALNVRIWDGAALVATPFLDLTGIAQSTLSTGLRGLAFHPNYAVNGWVFVWYDAIDAQGDYHLAIGRLQRSSTQVDQVDPSTFVEILREPQFIQGHGATSLQFGPDGMLYVALGDGGNRDDPMCNAQNHQTLMGTMLRIDVDSGLPYTIPPDNPFLNDPNVRDECWHLGMRHPWGWSFDRLTGDLWIADIGNDRFEEVNFVPRGQGGRNFGWSVMEANECFALSACPTTAPPCADPAYTAPIHAYDHFTGCSIMGGSVYRGAALPSQRGHYFYADWCTGEVWSLRWDGNAVVDLANHAPGLVSLNGGTLDRPLALAEDARGEILIIDWLDQEIYRLVSECHVESYCPQSPNSQGQITQLSSSGTARVSSSDWVLHVQAMPAGGIGHIFYSSHSENTPFGLGTLCVSTTTNYFRLPNYVANPLGRAHFPPDFSRAPLASGPSQVLPGSTWYFQAWYRDPGAPSGLQSRLSNALAIFFCP